ncbi:MAG: hypothetical protein SGPRY_008669 [Prymnesium sp.]
MRSTLRGAGGGLFAARFLSKCSWLGPYTGNIVSAKKGWSPEYKRGYVMRMSGRYVDAKDPHGRLVLADGRRVSEHCLTEAFWRTCNTAGVAWEGTAGLTRFVNEADHSGRKGNVSFRRDARRGHKFGLVTTREVQQGAELLVHRYGKGFWEY